MKALITISLMSMVEKSRVRSFQALGLRLWKIVLLLLISLHCHGKELSIKVGVFTDQLSQLTTLTRHEDCPAVTLDNTGENQMLLEYLIICNLLQDDTTQINVELVGYPVVPRLVSGIATGEVDISGFGIWKKESQVAGILLSQPLLEPGEFSKGLYMTQASLEALETILPGNLATMIAVSNRNWTYDWQLLNCEFKQVLHIDRYEQMFQMLALKRADILPLAFGKNKAMTREEFGTTLYPVQGIKLAFPDSTHVLLAKDSPFANIWQDKINSRLTTLKQQRTLHGWYVDAGVIKPETQNWRGLCSQ